VAAVRHFTRRPPLVAVAARSQIFRPPGQKHREKKGGKYFCDAEAASFAFARSGSAFFAAVNAFSFNRLKQNAISPHSATLLQLSAVLDETGGGVDEKNASPSSR
jgi:hypothetical protein